MRVGRRRVPSRRNQPFLGVAPSRDNHVFGDRVSESDEDRQDDRQENQSAEQGRISSVGVVCVTCQHFTYGVDQHCYTILGCNLRQKQLQQGQHLKRRCKLWAPTWKKQVGWAPEAS